VATQVAAAFANAAMETGAAQKYINVEKIKGNLLALSKEKQPLFV
jgi:malate dehydrogenase (oxaloacetate-decarboxylating)